MSSTKFIDLPTAELLPTVRYYSRRRKKEEGRGKKEEGRRNRTQGFQRFRTP
ncbi:MULTISPECIES: hypothetical protein [unclassified Microcoleus]|uniref:hypothetical protein n=1 Tax=unclassified Microcoleus TaxID=2642155 RepID=UPI002FD19D29